MRHQPSKQKTVRKH